MIDMLVMTVNAKVASPEKKMRQYRTGRPLQFYAGEEFIAALDRWRGQQPGVPGRSEAIRRLCELGLAADADRAPPPKRGKGK
jgi:hypothetical protein